VRRCFETIGNACLVFVLLFAIAASFAPSPGHSEGAVLSVAAQTPAAANATVTNDLTMVSSTISLDSSLQVQGRARVGVLPLQDAPISLHIGDFTVAHTTTDQNGAYSFSVPVGLYYFPAAVSRGATVYTVVEPSSASSASTSSPAISVPVNYLPFYVALGVVVVAILLAIALPMRRRRRKRAAAGSGAKHAEETGPLVDRERVSASEYVAPREGVYVEALPATREPAFFAPEVLGEPDFVNQARTLFAQGNDRAAVNALYDAALTLLAVAPEVRAPLRTLTAIYDRANFSGAPLHVSQQNAAIETFRAIKGGGEPAGRADNLDFVNQARTLFAQGNDRAAVNALYDAALTSLADAHGLTLQRDLTHLEKYRIIEAAVPEAREPVRTLTTLYELANYSGKRLRTEQRNAAISAYEWIAAHIRSLKKSE